MIAARIRKRLPSTRRAPLFTLAFGIALYWLWTLVAPLYPRHLVRGGWHTPLPLVTTRVYPIGYVLRDPGLRVVSILATDVPPGTPVTALLMTRTRTRYFAHEADRWDYHFEVGPLSHGLSAAELQQARALSAGLLRGRHKEWASFIPMFMPGNTGGDSIVWKGVAIDAAAAACALGFLASLYWVPAAIRAIPAWLQARAMAKIGRCGACGYSLAGLPGPLCPECGGRIRPLSRTAAS